MNGVVIVGAGQAGLQTALSLRVMGYSGEVTLVGEETHPPYQRPPLSKGYLVGELDEADLTLRTIHVLEEERIDLITGVAVVDALAPTTADPGLVQLSDGRSLAADAIVLATGATARQLPVPGNELAGIFTLRTIDDARALGMALGSAKRVVVVGGGFIGLEAAAVCRQSGLDVTVIEASHRLCARAVTPVLSDHLLARHQAMGTNVELEGRVCAFHGTDGQVQHVELASGEVLPADLVIVGVGAAPRTALAQRLGAECDYGILVDAHCRTNVTGVLAVGDCTQGGHVAAPPSTRLESVHNAVEQGKVAAAALVGQDDAYAAPPFFWSDQGMLKIQLVGLTADVDRLVVRGEVGGPRVSVLAYRDGRLVGADCANDPHDFMAARRALAMGRSLDPDLAEVAASLKACLVD